jgi:hypothetical protein
MKALEKGAYNQRFQCGLGVLIQSDCDYVDIDFDLHGIKKFVTTIIVVEHPEGTPSARRWRRRNRVAVITLKPAGLE